MLSYCSLSSSGSVQPSYSGNERTSRAQEWYGCVPTSRGLVWFLFSESRIKLSPNLEAGLCNEIKVPFKALPVSLLTSPLKFPSWCKICCCILFLLLFPDGVLGCSLASIKLPQLTECAWAGGC